RMIMLGLECTGEVPFRQVYLHGMVRDAEGQKMSKTKGNVIDPLEVTEKYGTDAVRMAILMGAAPGTDITIGPDRIESARAFANKIWNASRLIFMRMEASQVDQWLPREVDCCLPIAVEESLEIPLEDRWIFSRLNRCAESVNRSVEQYRFHEVAQTLWAFFWHEFCDWYLELKKLRLRDESGLNSDWRNLLTVYEMALRLLHPVMPFLTEELWQRLASGCEDRPESIALAHYPQYNPNAAAPDAEYEMSILQAVISAAREVRADLKLDPKATIDAVLVAREAARNVALQQTLAIEKLGGLRLSVVASSDNIPGVKRSTPAFDLIIQVSAEQAAAHRSRGLKEIANLEKLIANSERQLGDETFMGRAPAHVVDTIRQKLGEYGAQLVKLRESLQ
ncbi:MAG: class I tRNA ligase family protein, partial [Bryobacteraceae bacterium]|nr:class I tRNA ligase family protein [Bryobacteraceae bacterium]